MRKIDDAGRSGKHTSSRSSPDGLRSDRLCEFCQKINFNTLLVPTEQEFQRILNGQTIDNPSSFFGPVNQSKGDAIGDRHKELPLGTGKRIFDTARTCQICSLLAEMLYERAEEIGLNLTPELSEKLDCTARYTYYGEFTLTTGTRYVYQRLTVFCWNPYPDVALRLDCCLQACDPGASKLLVDGEFRDPRPNADMRLFGGRSRPLQIDINWIKSWIKICTKSHPDCDLLKRRQNSRIPLIRLVDVVDDCIVSFENKTASDIPRYLALSYVWGATSPEPKLLGSNQNHMSQKGSLLINDLSQTRADAIHLARALEIRYVWMDILCILQGDTEGDIQDKVTQIDLMKEIYSMAFITVLAAGGRDADSGLPGLRLGTRTRKQREIIVDLPHSPLKDGIPQRAAFMRVLNPLASDLHNDISTTIWNSRAWTLQERMLSRRVLAFTPEQVLWLCNTTEFKEETYCEHSIPFTRFRWKGIEANLPRSNAKNSDEGGSIDEFFEDFRSIVRFYTIRNISFENDVVNAFAGIQAALVESSNETFVWGLPLSRFGLAMGWTAFKGNRRRSQVIKREARQTLQSSFGPSWSWLGWVGEAMIDVTWQRSEAQEVRIHPYILVKSKESPAKLSFMLASDLGKGDSSSGSMISVDEVIGHVPDISRSILESQDNKSLLYFEAFCIETKVDYHPDSKRRDRRTFNTHGLTVYLNPKPHILDHNGLQIGELDGFLADDESLFSPAALTDLSNRNYEFIALSYEEMKFGDENFSKYYVLQVERQGPFLQRLSAGEIPEQDWNAMNPKKIHVLMT